MSNTDGEDTKQFDETLLNTPESIEESGYISKGKKLSQSAYKLVQKNKSLEQDLASIREQLKAVAEISWYRLDKLIEAKEQLKQQEEVIRELIEALVSASECLESEGYQQFPEEINAVIKKAKSLTTKDK